MDLFIQNRLNPDGRLDTKGLAVLALHWQNDLVLPEGKFGFFAKEIARLGLVPKMVRLLQAARSAGGTVIYVNVACSADARDVIKNSPLFLASSKVSAFVRGTWGAEVIEELRPQPDDFDAFTAGWCALPGGPKRPPASSPAGCRRGAPGSAERGGRRTG
jgi:hypothetical protein